MFNLKSFALFVMFVLIAMGNSYANNQYKPSIEINYGALEKLKHKKQYQQKNLEYLTSDNLQNLDGDEKDIYLPDMLRPQVIEEVNNEIAPLTQEVQSQNQEIKEESEKKKSLISRIKQISFMKSSNKKFVNDVNDEENELNNLLPIKITPKSFDKKTTQSDKSPINPKDLARGMFKSTNINQITDKNYKVAKPIDNEQANESDNILDKNYQESRKVIEDSIEKVENIKSLQQQELSKNSPVNLVTLSDNIVKKDTNIKIAPAKTRIVQNDNFSDNLVVLNFNENATKLTKIQELQLDEMINLTEENKNNIVRIFIFDENMFSKRNLERKLSLQRAISVRSYLIYSEFEKEQIFVKTSESKEYNNQTVVVDFSEK